MPVVRFVSCMLICVFFVPAWLSFSSKGTLALCKAFVASSPLQGSHVAPLSSQAQQLAETMLANTERWTQQLKAVPVVFMQCKTWLRRNYCCTVLHPVRSESLRGLRAGF